MQVISDPRQLRATLRQMANKRIGFVPTMGAFHGGHVSLFHKARAENDVVVVSAYVNPTQFGLGEDYKTYPRNVDRDRTIAEEEGIDILFTPSDKDVYPAGQPVAWVRIEALEAKLCGAYRPGHFRGVATVVAKLLNMVQPDKAYFGEKDYQQLIIIEQMAKDLCFGAEIVRVPISRETDGLAMSSRNVYLSPEERKAAAVLYRALLEGRNAAQRGEKTPEGMSRAMEAELAKEPLCKPQYIGVYDACNLDQLSGRAGGCVLLAVAANFGNTRLIDNLVLRLS